MLKKPSICLLFAVVLMILLPALNASAANSIAELVTMTGRVDILRNGKLPSEKAQIGSKLYVGDFIRTKSKSTAEVLFADGNQIKIEPRSRVDISTYAPDRDERALKLSRGKVEAVVLPGSKVSNADRPKRFEIHTPNAVAGVRGTTLVVAFQNSITAIMVTASHSGKPVYSISKFHPEQIIDIPVGGMMWVSNQGLPTTIPPSSELGFSLLSQSLASPENLGDLLVLVDALTSDEQLPPIFSETFPEALGVEVGVFFMDTSTSVPAGSFYDMAVSMTGHFFAVSPDAAPFFWNADDVSISWTPVNAILDFDPTGTPAFIASPPVAAGASATFTVTNWDTSNGNWSAVVDSGFGDAANGTSFDFAGTASGTGVTATTSSGSVSGTASGIAIEAPAGM
jgi:hypothetical protein